MGMNLNDLGTSIYKGTPTWTNMNRLEMYMNSANADTSDTITLSNVKLEYITSAPTQSPTATPTPSPTYAPSNSPTAAPTPTPTDQPTKVPTPHSNLDTDSASHHTPANP